MLGVAVRGLSRRVLGLRESPTRRIDAVREEAARRGLDIIMLSTGQPSIPPPIEVRRRLAEDLLEDGPGLYSYTPTRGYSSLIDAIRVEMSRWGVDLERGQVTVTAGGQSALFGALSTVLEPGDEVVVLDPLYFGYWPLLDYLEARPRVVETRLEDGFQPPGEGLLEAVSRRTKALIIVTPDNPTGRTIDERTARLLADLSVDYDFWLVVDEAYRTLVYEGEHVYLWRLAPDNVIGLGTFSKDPGIPGWRLGFAYGPEEVVRRISLVVQETVYCPPSPAQRLVEYYLLDEEVRMRHLRYVRRIYRERRDALLEAIDRHLPGARYVRPSGGMFAYVDLSEVLGGSMDSEEFSKALLEEKGVATIPGTFFSRRGEGFLRLSFVGEPPERLEEAVRRMRELLEEKGIL